MMGNHRNTSFLLWCFCALYIESSQRCAIAFSPLSSKKGIQIRSSCSSSGSSLFAGKKLEYLDKRNNDDTKNRVALLERNAFLQIGNNNNSEDNNINNKDKEFTDNNGILFTLFLLTVLGTFTTTASVASADGIPNAALMDTFNPKNFQPVCQISDEFYRGLQGGIRGLVGPDQFVEYGPLIASGLLRVRLELCVVESFFSEAVIPFIQKNGLKWVLPLHETVETFLAGTVFATATTFILVGSTKLLTVIAFYGDLFFGAPCRTLGGFVFDRANGKPVTLDIGIGPLKTRVIGPPDDEEQKIMEAKQQEDKDFGSLVILGTSGTVKFFGKALEFFREFFEGLDVFVGRYLVLLATAYIGIKFLHFKIFPNFP